MKACIVGLGSIGTRHLKNLRAIFQDRQEELTVDALRSGNRPLSNDVKALIHAEFFRSEDLPDDYDSVFICNPTSLHFDTVKALANKTHSFFIEKPVFHDPNADISQLGLSENCVCYVAAPLRYTSVLQELKRYLVGKKVYAVRSICSTYLPDWRPGIDYRQCYSARKELGGGVNIDLIHEWDYLCFLFGKPKRVISMQGKYSNLEISSDDLAVYTGEYEDKLLTLHLDYFGRVERREIEVFTDEDTIVGDIRNQEIRFLKEGKRISLEESRDTFQKRELLHFLDIAERKTESDNTIQEALDTLKISRGEWI